MEIYWSWKGHGKVMEGEIGKKGWTCVIDHGILQICFPDFNKFVPFC